MKIKGVRVEDFTNYKTPAMFIAFPSCTFKCERECGKKFCQNASLTTAPNIYVDIDSLVNTYINSEITKAIVCGGLEPFDSWDDLLCLIKAFRARVDDPIIIYTGYNLPEIKDKINILRVYKKIIVKFGRFVPGQKPHMDKVLGVMLASDNQYAVQLTEEKNS